MYKIRSPYRKGLVTIIHRLFNPSMSKGGGGKITPQTTFFAAILEPLGIGGCALATFPRYKLATRWRFQTISDTFRKSNMAAGKPEMLGNQPITRQLGLCSNYKRNFNGYRYIFDHARPRYDTADMVRHRSRNRKWKPEVKRGSGNNISAERAGEAIPAATPTFSTTPDQNMALSTVSDISLHRKHKLRARNRK